MYILQKPQNKGLVKNPANWEFSSYKDYMELRNGTLCNKELAFNLLGFSKKNIKLFEDSFITEELIKNIF